MTLSFIQSGKFVKFVPIEFAERIGKSKIRATRDILRTLQIMTQVIIYYNPLKIAVVMAIFPVVIAILEFIFGTSEELFEIYFLLAISSIIFMLGCIIEFLRLSKKNDRK